MAASSSCRIHGFDYDLLSKRKTHVDTSAHVSSFPFSQALRPNLSSNCKSFAHFRGCSYKRNKTLERWYALPRISCLIEDESGPYSEEGQSSVLETSQKEAAIDLKLPRRSLLVTFTCNVCEARSERLINRLAYERGLVYVQCSGCSKYHKLVDNLGLVVEYNLQEEIDSDTSADNV